jgi:class 3 adenylate cyclase
VVVLESRKLSAILALDVVGYTRLMHQDAADILSALNTIYRSVVRPAVRTVGRSADGLQNCSAMAH